MGERFRRQDNRIVDRKLALINIRRAMAAALVMTLLIPVTILFGASLAEGHSGFYYLMLVFEIISLTTAGIDFYALKKGKLKSGLVSYRVFWAAFEILGMYLAYVSRAEGAGVSFYPIMICVLTLVPLLSLGDLIYAVTAEMIFILVLSVNQGTFGMEIFDIIILNAILIGASRSIYSHMREFIALKENSSEKTGRSLTDVPTGLLNRNGFERNAFRVFTDCIRRNTYASVLMIDIDNLKDINTAYGTRSGDDCIRTVAASIRALSAKYNSVSARLDGGKFAVFMEGSSSEEALRLGEKIRSVVYSKRMAPLNSSDSKFMAVSVGIASFVPDEEKEFALLYEEAEDSMISAKELGKNRAIFENRPLDQFYMEAN